MYGLGLVENVHKADVVAESPKSSRMCVAAIASGSVAAIRHEEIAKAGKPKSTRGPSGGKAVILAIGGGVLMESFFPLVQNTTDTEVGLGPYAVSVLFALGVLASTPVFDIFFINLPVEGEPVELIECFRSKPKQHLLAWSGGAMWSAAMISAFVASAAPTTIHVSFRRGIRVHAGLPRARRPLGHRCLEGNFEAATQESKPWPG